MTVYTEDELGQARDLLLEAASDADPRARHADAKASRSEHLLDALVDLAASYGFEAGRDVASWHFRRVAGGPLLVMEVDPAGEIAGEVHPTQGEARTVRPGRDLAYDPGRNAWLGPASKTHSVPGRPLVRFTALEHLVRTALALTRP